MTSIKLVMDDTNIICNIGTKKEKLKFISLLQPEVQQFLGGNINMNGIGPEIFNEIQIGYPNTNIESLIKKFDTASKVSSSNEKRAIIQTIFLPQDEKNFIGRALYSLGGNLNLGVTISRVSNGITDVISPMLAKAKDFDPSDYQIEPKLDGYRLIARKIDGEIYLQSRNGKPLVIERITQELERCLPEGCMVDGEILAMNGDFQSLKRHGDDITYGVFDILYVDGKNIMDKTLTCRRSYLERLDLDGRVSIPKILDLSTLDDVDKWIRITGAEGVVAKDPLETYQPKKRGWIKYKCFKDLSARVIGVTSGTGKRVSSFGSLEVIPSGLKEITRIGTGFKEFDLINIKNLLSQKKTIIIDVKYQQITNGGKLRFPVFLRIKEVI